MNSKTEQKNSPLIEAVIHKDLQAFNTLIHQCDINAQGENGTTALIEATYRSQDPIGEKMFFELLNQPQTDVNQKDSFGLTALGVAVTRNWDLLPALLKKGANPNVYTIAKLPGKSDIFTHQKTPWRKISCLSFAIWKANYKAVLLLLKYHADVNMISSLDITPLSMSARMNDDKVLDHLIKKAHAELNVLPANWREFTSNRQKACPVALRKALKYGSYKCVEKLIQAGCTLPKIIYRADQTFATPLTYVLQQIPTVHQSYINAKDYMRNPSFTDYVYTIQTLLNETDVQPQAVDSNGRTALSYMAEKGMLSFAEKVLTPDTINLADHKGLTPLAYALANNQKPMVHYLLDHGADPDCTVPDVTSYKEIIRHNTLHFIPAVQFALKTRNIDVIQKMLHKGVSLRFYKNYKQLFYEALSHQLPTSLINKLLYCRQSEKNQIPANLQHNWMQKKIQKILNRQRQAEKN